MRFPSNGREVRYVKLHRVTVIMASGKRPAPFRTRKLSCSAPMVLQGGPCGRVGRRRTYKHPRGDQQWSTRGCFCVRRVLRPAWPPRQICGVSDERGPAGEGRNQPGRGSSGGRPRSAGRGGGSGSRSSSSSYGSGSGRWDRPRNTQGGGSASDRARRGGTGGGRSGGFKGGTEGGGAERPYRFDPGAGAARRAPAP